ncbi:MAG TPA: tetratricopeptide repeat protein [Nitrospirota bacterium]|nr:tetratricopeptide repeat protein [Nitrospirota bacterium]
MGKKSSRTRFRRSAVIGDVQLRITSYHHQAAILSLCIIICLVIAANVRNGIYKTPVSMWTDTALKSPTKRRVHENLGQALSTAGLYSDAMREFKTVISLRDDGSVPPRDLYREIGVVYFRVGMIDDAITSWQKGLQYAPFDASLLNNLSVALLKKGRLDEAAANARMALSAAPGMPQALNTLGEVLMSQGQYDKAVECFLTAIQNAPEDKNKYWNAALAFAKAGKPDMAYQYMNRYAAMEPDPAGRQRALLIMNSLRKPSSGASRP